MKMWLYKLLWFSIDETTGIPSFIALCRYCSFYKLKARPSTITGKPKKFVWLDVLQWPETKSTVSPRYAYIAQRSAALSSFPKCLVLPINFCITSWRAHLLLTGKNKRADSKSPWSGLQPQALVTTPAKVFSGWGVWLLYLKCGFDSPTLLFEELFGGGNSVSR